MNNGDNKTLKKKRTIKRRKSLRKKSPDLKDNINSKNKQVIQIQNNPQDVLLEIVDENQTEENKKGFDTSPKRNKNYDQLNFTAKVSQFNISVNSTNMSPSRKSYKTPEQIFVPSPKRTILGPKNRAKTTLNIEQIVTDSQNENMQKQAFVSSTNIPTDNFDIKQRIDTKEFKQRRRRKSSFNYNLQQNKLEK